MRTRWMVAVGVWLSACAGPKTAGLGAPNGARDVPVPGVRGAVSVWRDGGGVVHVDARTDADAMFGLGWAHGRSTLATLDAKRRLAVGRTAEITGEAGVPYDTFARALDLRGHADRILLRSGDEERTLLTAYVAGVNAAAVARPQPPTAALDHQPFAPLTPSEVLAMLDMEALAASGNLPAELAALALVGVHPDRLDALLRPDDPPRSDDPALDTGWETFRSVAPEVLTPAFAAWSQRHARPPVTPLAFAHAGEDALLGVSLSLPPSTDPQSLTVALRGRTLRFTGVTLPGIPAAWSGHNDTLAFAVVPAFADTVDVVRVSRTGPHGYTLEGRDRVLQEPVAELVVAGGTPIRVVTPQTAVGPLISTPDVETALALRWTGAALTRSALPGLWALARTSSAAQAARVWLEPSAGVWRLLAVDHSHVTDRVVGGVVRRRGVTGRVPYDVSGEGETWQGWADVSPSVLAASDGWRVAAGERPDLLGAGALGTAVAPGTRAARAQTLLDGGVVDDAAAWGVLSDVHVAWDPATLQDAAPTTAAGQSCLAALRAWDGEATAESGAPLVWVALKHTLEDARTQDLSAAQRQAVRAGARRDAPWPATDPETTGQALDQVCPRLAHGTAAVAGLGEDAGAWRWGDAHQWDPRDGLDVRVVAASPRRALSGTGSTLASTGWPGRGATWDADEAPAVRVLVGLGEAPTMSVAAGMDALEDVPPNAGTVSEERSDAVRLVPRGE